MTDLFMGDDAYHSGAFMLAANFGFYTFFKPHGRADARRSHQCPSIWARPTAMSFISTPARPRNLDKQYLKGGESALQRPDRTTPLTTTTGRPAISRST